MSDRLSKGAPLTDLEFHAAAEVLHVEAAKLWAILEIEAQRCGFLEDQRPVILFERHKFFERTSGRFSESHPDLCHAEAGGYGRGGSNQHTRFERAAELDRDAAIWSTSWGLGQVMGFNAQQAGFRDGISMANEMSRSEGAQLLGMVRYIVFHGLERSLRVSDWTSFAIGYNGPKYYKNKYDDRLRGAYQKFSTGPMPDLRVREAQMLLLYKGYDPGPVDGWYGPQTMRALAEFRATTQITASEELSDEDLESLREI